MLRIFALLLLIFISSNSFGQISPWPWNALSKIQPWPLNLLVTKSEISNTEIKAMAVKNEKDEIVVVIYGEKSSPTYNATLTELPEPPSIIGYKDHKKPVLKFSFKKQDDGTIAPQIVTPFAITKTIKTNSDSLWIIVGNDEAILIDIIGP